jgi:hypothetical protein
MVTDVLVVVTTDAEYVEPLFAGETLAPISIAAVPDAAVIMSLNDARDSVHPAGDAGSRSNILMKTELLFMKTLSVVTNGLN